MTSVLQQPRLQPYTARPSTGGGILLNPINATPPPSLSNSLSLPYTSDDDHLLRSRSGSAPEFSASGSRRIRFAPLPDPRRAVLVTEHGEELPLPSVFDDDDPSNIPRPNLHSFPATPTPSFLLGDGIVKPKELPTIIPSCLSSRSSHIRSSFSSSNSPFQTSYTYSPTPSTATVTPTPSSPNPSSTRLAKRLFYPFRQKRDDARRPGSRDSSSSRDDVSLSWGIPLGHWTSADASGRRGSLSSTYDAPLARAQSATSAIQPRQKRLLNGRIYGARKHPHQSSNAFQNVPDKEPEFVEWGHGGMGSVRAGGMWAKVQSNQKLLIGHMEERGRRGAPQATTDEDDGSGMGWVKRRREERERKNREEQAARPVASKSNADVDSAHSVVSAPVPVQAAAHTPTTAPTVASTSGTSSNMLEQHYKQVLGAGVERVSRHRD
ncbi:hypothetical protein B0F90DRAFT_1667376 [Multifurca ochricompacta]|uniref:Uncharacterized protein n=1 Tax=Multifurca ochricompacta TaxID=376703 RepID=A0AAD4QM45_9AGAM|nr:hypothetical protein B0F90DRAFT_1667376 [Multifurca ochricompacta]